MDALGTAMLTFGAFTCLLGVIVTVLVLDIWHHFKN